MRARKTRTRKWHTKQITKFIKWIVNKRFGYQHAHFGLKINETQYAKLTADKSISENVYANKIDICINVIFLQVVWLLRVPTRLNIIYTRSGIITYLLTCNIDFKIIYQHAFTHLYYLLKPWFMCSCKSCLPLRIMKIVVSKFIADEISLKHFKL